MRLEYTYALLSSLSFSVFFVFLFKLNWILFLATLWSLRPTLANMRSDISQSKDTRYEPGMFKSFAMTKV